MGNFHFGNYSGYERIVVTGFSSCNSTENHVNYITKNQISKARFWQNCSVAKMLRFAVLSASLPCAMMSKMHVLKTRTEPETLRGTVILCLAIMIMRENAENPDSELCPFF